MRSGLAWTTFAALDRSLRAGAFLATAFLAGSLGSHEVRQGQHWDVHHAFPAPG